MDNARDLNISSSIGKTGCRCTDEAAVLASRTKRSCQTLEGQNGVLLTAQGKCVPYSYGSGCLRHDLMNDPECELKDSGEWNTPDYCLRSWCYVDAVTCRQSSSERVHRSTYFPRDSGVNLVSLSNINSCLWQRNISFLIIIIHGLIFHHSVLFLHHMRIH